MKKLAIVGNGTAAITAVRELGRMDATIAMDVFSDEPYSYYPRPRIIDFLAGDVSIQDLIQYSPEWYEQYNAHLHLEEPVKQLDVDSMSLKTTAKRYHGYDRILVAVGSHPWIPPIHGADKENVHTLRTLRDAATIRKGIETTNRQIIIGGGILGIEIAAALEKYGGNTLTISHIDTLLPKQLDSAASSVLLKRLIQLGLNILMNVECKKILGDKEVEALESTTGDRVEGDMVIIATGVRPNITLAKTAGLRCNRGIVVDAHMQTSEKGCFAAGDCTEWQGVSWGIIPVALDTGKVAARNMVDLGGTHYNGTTPRNTLKVAGIDLTSIGEFNPVSPKFESVVQVDEKKGTYFKAVLKDHTVVGGIALGNRKVALKLQRLVSTGKRVERPFSDIFE
jgi:nitrite reductase (NADH) large subunit